LLEAHAWDVVAATSTFFDEISTDSAGAQGGSNRGLKRPLAASMR
jgi:hypothetical protein